MRAAAALPCVAAHHNSVPSSAEELAYSGHIVTAASELACNTVQYGGGGIMRLEVVNQHSRCGLQLTFEGQGPGIPDTAVVLPEGYSTGGGLGLGLPGTRRLTDEFEVVSRPGADPRVRIVKQD